MTKRKILVMIITLVLSVSLCACSTEEQSKQSKADIQSQSGIFPVVAESDVGSYDFQSIMYDPDTMVMYTYLDGNHTGTMGVIYNADGTLKLYSPNTEARTLEMLKSVLAKRN